MSRVWMLILLLTTAGGLRVMNNQVAMRRASAITHANMRQTPPQAPLIIDVDPCGADTWRLGPAADIIKAGGVGVIPTDSSYALVCSVDSKEGIERLLRIKVGLP